MAYNPYGPKPERLIRPVTDVVHTTQDDHPALSRNLMRDLQAERAKHYEGLISAKDWADFEKRRGLIHGIESAIELCKQQQSKLDG